MVEVIKNFESLFRLYPDYDKEYVWSKSDKVGRGGFGTVYKAIRKQKN